MALCSVRASVPSKALKLDSRHCDELMGYRNIGGLTDLRIDTHQFILAHKLMTS